MSMREIYIPEHILDNLIKVTGVGKEYAHKTLHWLLIDIRNLGYAIDEDHKMLCSVL